MAKEQIPSSSNTTADDSSISPVNPFEGKDGDDLFNTMAKLIRSKVYGIDVREAIARGIEGSGYALTSSKDASDSAIASMNSKSKEVQQKLDDNLKIAQEELDHGISLVQNLLDWANDNQDSFNSLVDAVDRYGDTPIESMDTAIKAVVQRLIYMDTYYEWRSGVKSYDGWTYDYGIGLRGGVVNLRLFNLYSTKARNKSGGSTGLVKDKPPEPFAITGGVAELTNNSTATKDGLSGLIRFNKTINNVNFYMTLDNYYQGDNTIGYANGVNITKQTVNQVESQYYFITNSAIQMPGEIELLEQNATYIRRGAMAKELSQIFGIPAESKG